MPRRYRRRRYKKFSKASKALYIAKKVQRMNRPEKKQAIQQATDTTMSDAGTIVQLCNMQEGDTNQKRDGGQVRFVSATLNYLVQRNASADTSVVRIMLIQDKQTNGAIFALSDLLFDATIVDNIVSPLNLNNARRFKVLYDKQHAVAANNRVVLRKKFLKLNIPVRYDANAGLITDLTQDSLALVFITDEPSLVPVITYNVRLRFTDV